ncbi:MAG: leucine-rich repeat protein, partial [Oscillospiraceae bacterium]
MTKKLERSTAFLSAFAMFMMILLYFPVGTFSNTNWAMTASAYTEGYFRYEVSEDGGCNYITEYFGREETVTVPSIIVSKPVYSIKSGTFSNLNSVKTVYLPDTIGEIEDGAFNESQTVWLKFPQNLTNLTSSYTEKYIERNKKCTLKLTAADGYNLPSSINIYRYTTPLNAGTDYTYDSSTGDITILADSVDIPLSITASAKKVESATISFADYYATTDPLNPVIIATADIPENGTVSIPVSDIEKDENYNYAYYWQYVEENGIIVVNEAVEIDEYEDIDDDFNCITVKEFEKTDAIAGMEYFVYVVRTGKLGSINYYVDGAYANNTLSLSPTRYNYGNNITYAAVPNKDGYDFDGWYFESDYSGEKFTEHSLEDYKDKYDQYRILKLYGRYVPETIITEATTTTISETTTTEATTTTISET